MDTVIPIYDLRDIHVASDAGQHIGIVAVHVLGIDKEGDHIVKSESCSLFEVRTETHRDIVSRGFGAGIGEVLILVNNETEGPGEKCFHSSDVDFTVALASVTIARFEEAAFGQHRIENAAAGDEFLVIHVAALHCWWPAADTSLTGRNAHAAEEWMQRDDDAGTEVGDHLFAVERNDLRFGIRKFTLKKAGSSTEVISGEGSV